ncbi:hypothetical protein [Enterococcus phage VPE25]|nr:hypothetical protein [Enterococcus phage VPE25]
MNFLKNNFREVILVALLAMSASLIIKNNDLEMSVKTLKDKNETYQNVIKTVNENKRFVSDSKYGNPNWQIMGHDYFDKKSMTIIKDSKNNTEYIVVENDKGLGITQRIK